MPPVTADMLPTLDSLAEQAEAVAARGQALEEGLDEIPPAQRDAWKRVLRGCVSGEGIEEWVVEPMLEGLCAAGLDEAAVVRFFHSQGADELRHRDLFAAYLERHWNEPPKANDTLAHKLLYEGVFKGIIRRSAKHPLRLLMPLLFYERAAGSLYMTRLIDCTPDSMPRLRALLKTIRADEARHVAGVGLTVRALVARQQPDAAERKKLMRICTLVYHDMDRTAWWKPGLAGYMRDLGLDSEAMRRDNDLILAEMRSILEGRQ